MVDLKRSITIVTSSTSAPGVVSLRDAAEAEGIGVTILTADSLDVAVIINASDRVIYRIGPKSYLTYKNLLPSLNQSRARNNLDSALLSFDKIEIAHTFEICSIQHPKSRVLKKDETPDVFPVIIKIRHGNKGKGVGLLKNSDDYLEFIAEFPDELDYLLQEYIESATAQDKRLFVVGDKLVAAMKRTSAGNDFRANLHTGGSAVPYAPTNEEIQLAVRATQAFKLQYCGVDIIDSPKGPLVLEVNPSPGFAISKITGIDVAREVIKGVINAKY